MLRSFLVIESMIRCSSGVKRGSLLESYDRGAASYDRGDAWYLWALATPAESSGTSATEAAIAILIAGIFISNLRVAVVAVAATRR